MGNETELERCLKYYQKEYTCCESTVEPWGFQTWLCDTHNKRCTKCGVSRMEHEDNGDHPHFNNNLEMLEWHSQLV